MITWALIAQKGGAGKTTLALHLAYEAASAGKRTLLIDLDQQASAAHWADRRAADVAVDFGVAAGNSGNIRATIAGARAEGIEMCIIDTAPNADMAGLAAAKVADLVLIPCRPYSLDIDAVGATVDVCRLARRPYLVVLNATPIRSRVVAETREVMEGWGAPVCPMVISERVALKHCMTDGRVVQEYEPHGAAAAEIATLYRYLTGGNALSLTGPRSSRQAGELLCPAGGV
jgi:chromosome partitioning protein